MTSCGYSSCRSLLVDDLADLLCGAVEILVIEDVELFLLAGDHLLGHVGVGALEAQYHRLGERVLLVGLDDGSGEIVAAQDTAENVHEDRLNLVIIVQQLESFNKCLTFGAAADVKEVSGLATVQLDDVHGGHGQASTIDKAADVAANVNVVQIEVLGMSLAWVILSLVFLLGEVLLAEEGVRIDSDFAISTEHITFLSQHKWVDLDHVGVLSHEAVIDFAEDVLDLIGLLSNAKICGSLTKLGRIESF